MDVIFLSSPAAHLRRTSGVIVIAPFVAKEYWKYLRDYIYWKGCKFMQASRVLQASQAGLSDFLLVLKPVLFSDYPEVEM